MSDIRFNRWLHQSGTGGVYQAGSGNVGIGTSVPSTTLDVNGSISATSITATTGTITGNLSVGGVLTYDDVNNIDSIGIITARSDVSIADKIVHTGDTNTAIRFPAADTFTVETAGSERLRITDSLKEVKNGPLRITSTFVEFSGDISTPAAAAALYRPADNQFAISTGNVERLRATSAGLVGIATAVPSYRLDIGDGATDPANGYQLRVNAAGDYIFALQRQSVPSFSIRNNSTGIVHLNTQNSKILALGVSSGNASGSIEDDVRIDSNGHLTVRDGNLVIGTSGHGIDFSSTSDTSGMSSELLDDYEEGIHTVAFSASNGGTVTVSSGDDQISYVKIGNHVTVTGRPVVTSVSSPQGNLRMTLPFTSSDLSDSAGRAACALNVRLLNSGYKVGMMNAYLDEGSNLLSFSYGDNNDSQHSAPAIKSGTQIWINISYRTT